MIRQAKTILCLGATLFLTETAAPSGSLKTGPAQAAAAVVRNTKVPIHSRPVLDRQTEIRIGADPSRPESLFSEISSIAVDGRGRLRSGMKEFPGWEGWHTLHLVSHGAPAVYLAHLRRLQIPYLISGERQIDLRITLEKMRARLGVRCVVCTAGSRLNGALLRAGLVDEISLVLLPAVIGGTATPTLFRSPELGPKDSPVPLELLSAKAEPGGRVCLHYRVAKRRNRKRARPRG